MCVCVHVHACVRVHFCLLAVASECKTLLQAYRLLAGRYIVESNQIHSYLEQFLAKEFPKRSRMHVQSRLVMILLKPFYQKYACMYVAICVPICNYSI